MHTLLLQQEAVEFDRWSLPIFRWSVRRYTDVQHTPWWSAWFSCSNVRWSWRILLRFTLLVLLVPESKTTVSWTEPNVEWSLRLFTITCTRQKFLYFCLHRFPWPKWSKPHSRVQEDLQSAVSYLLSRWPLAWLVSWSSNEPFLRHYHLHFLLWRMDVGKDIAMKVTTDVIRSAPEPSFWNDVSARNSISDCSITSSSPTLFTQYCVLCQDGASPLYNCSHCPCTLCQTCIVIAEESVEEIKESDVYFTCPGCHEMHGKCTSLYYVSCSSKWSKLLNVLCNRDLKMPKGHWYWPSMPPSTGISNWPVAHRYVIPPFSFSTSS
jgi:hypothetical protein